MVYNARGQVETIDYASGSTGSYSYKPARAWLQYMEVRDAALQAVYTKSYSHEPDGRIAGTQSNRTRQNWAYTYDDLGRLVVANNLSDDTLDQSFTYDIGNNILPNSALGT